MRDGMLEIARYSDYFLASQTFADAYAPGLSPEEVCRQLAGLGPTVTAVTLGNKGYVAIHDDKLISRPAYKVKTIDTTGCGDIFHAGFIYGILQHWTVEQCLDFGAWSAAMVSRFLGGRKGIPTLTEWNEFKSK